MNRFLAILLKAVFVSSTVFAGNPSSTYQVKFPDNGPIKFDISPDGKYMIALGPNRAGSSSHNILSVHEMASKKEVCRLEYFDFNSPKFSPDGSQFAVIEHSEYSTHPYSVDLYDTKTCTFSSTLESFDDLTYFWSENIQFSDDGASMLVYRDGALHLFDLKSSKLLSSFNGMSGFLSPDGKTVVVEQSGKLQLFAADGRMLVELKTDGYNFDFYQFSKDSSSLIYRLKSVSDHKTNLYSFDLKTGTKKTLISDLGRPYNYGLSPSGQIYVAGTENNGAHVFNLKNGTDYQSSPQNGYLNDISFNRDETMFVARVDEQYLKPTNTVIVENIITKKTVDTIKETSPIHQISLNPSRNQIVYVLEKEGLLKVIDL